MTGIIMTHLHPFKVKSFHCQRSHKAIFGLYDAQDDLFATGDFLFFSPSIVTVAHIFHIYTMHSPEYLPASHDRPKEDALAVFQMYHWAKREYELVAGCCPYHAQRYANIMIQDGFTWDGRWEYAHLAYRSLGRYPSLSLPNNLLEFNNFWICSSTKRGRHNQLFDDYCLGVNDDPCILPA